MKRLFILFSLFIGLAMNQPVWSGETETEQSVVQKNLDLAFWQSIEDSDNPEMYRAYLTTFPDGTFVLLAEIKLKELEKSSVKSGETEKQVSEEPTVESVSTTSQTSTSTPTPADNLQKLLKTKSCPGCNLPFVNLWGADLKEANLKGAYLTGARLVNVNLEGADLTGATMTRTNLTGANLTGANLRAAKLNWANLNWANLTEVNMAGTDLSNASLIRAKLTGVKKDSSTIWPKGFQIPTAVVGSSSSTASSNDSVWCVMGQIMKSKQSYCLSNGGTVFATKELAIAYQQRRSEIARVEAELEHDQLVLAPNIKRLFSTKECQVCDLRGADLSHRDLRGVDLEDALLSETDLSGADLSGANLTRAKLFDANLQGAKLIDSNLRGTMWHDATLKGANFTGAQLQSAYFVETDISELEGVDFSLATTDAYTMWPRGWRPSGQVNTSSSTTLTADLAFWQNIKESDDPLMFQAYLEKYPNGEFAVLVRIKLEKLKLAVSTSSITSPGDSVWCAKGSANSTASFDVKQIIKSKAWYCRSQGGTAFATKELAINAFRGGSAQALEWAASSITPSSSSITPTSSATTKKVNVQLIGSGYCLNEGGKLYYQGKPCIGLDINITKQEYENERRAEGYISTSIVKTPDKKGTDSATTKKVNVQLTGYCFNEWAKFYYPSNSCLGIDLKITKQEYENRRLSDGSDSPAHAARAAALEATARAIADAAGAEAAARLEGDCPEGTKQTYKGCE